MNSDVKMNMEKGQSLVELALTLLIILTLLAGAVDFGMAFFSYVALRDAAQEGALYGSLYPTDFGPNCADGDCIELRVKRSSTTPVKLDDPANVTISIPSPGTCRGETITVAVSYNYQLSMPFIGAILGKDTIQLTTSVTDTILNPKCPESP